MVLTFSNGGGDGTQPAYGSDPADRLRPRPLRGQNKVGVNDLGRVSVDPKCAGAFGSRLDFRHANVGAVWRRDAQRGSSEGLETRGEEAAWRGRFWFWFLNFIAYQDSPRLRGGGGGERAGGRNETIDGGRAKLLIRRFAAPTLIRNLFVYFLPFAN